MSTPAATHTIARDLALERHRTTTAAAAFTGSPGDDFGLGEMADQRAGTHGVHELAFRDFIQETREELADARNYLLWQMQQIDLFDAAPDELKTIALEDLGEALASVASAFAHVTLATSYAAGVRYPRPLTPQAARTEREAAAWREVRNVLEDNADGSSSAADVCAVGFRIADRLDRTAAA